MTQEKAKTYYYLVRLPSHLTYTYHSSELYIPGDVVIIPNVHLGREPIKGTITSLTLPRERTKAIIKRCPIYGCAFLDFVTCEYTNKACTHPNPVCNHWGVNDVK